MYIYMQEKYIFLVIEVVSSRKIYEMVQFDCLRSFLTGWFSACSWYQCWVYANLFGWSVMPNCLQQEETWSWSSPGGLWWSWFCSSATLLQALLDYQELMGSNVGRERILQDLPWAWRVWSQHHGFSSCCPSWCLDCFGLVLITKFPSWSIGSIVAFTENIHARPQFISYCVGWHCNSFPIWLKSVRVCRHCFRHWWGQEAWYCLWNPR